MDGTSTSTLCSSKFKRRRVDAIREFPRGCGRFPLAMDSRDGRLDIADNGKPPENPVTTQAAPRKYPLPRILKGSSVRRDFPCGFERQDFHSASKGAKPMEKAAAETAPSICPPKTLIEFSAKQVCPALKQNLFSVSHDVPANYCRKQSSFVSQENVSTNSCGNQNVGSVSKDIFPQNRMSIGDDPKPSNATRVANSKPMRFDDEDMGKKKASQHQESSASDKVNEALRLFHRILAKLKKENIEKLKTARDYNVPRSVAMILKEQKKWINTSKRVGPVPGVNIGDKFRFQSELIVIGLHCHFYNGIDSMKKNGISLAISIVVSDRYDNNRESSDVLIYSGHGGNPAVRSGQALKDQKLERGNLALKHSMDHKNPVRVIYKSKFKGSQSSSFGKQKNLNTIYVYDGLYTVEEFWEERGEFGKLVFKYKLRRNLDQPKLSRGMATNLRKCSSRRSGVFINDIPEGKEKISVCVADMLDNEKPPPFDYSAKMTNANSSDESMFSGCDCVDGCSDSEDCSCKIKNGGELPYNYKERCVTKRTFFYECGPSCKCFYSCINRVSQRGIQFQLEVFKTKSNGWGVRSRSYIPYKSFVCEYIRDKEATCGYFGSQDFNQFDAEEDQGFTFDAAQFGNVGRFINHSCFPNLYVHPVFYDHGDEISPHIMLFAMKDIPPLQELTSNHNYSGLGKI